MEIEMAVDTPSTRAPAGAPSEDTSDFRNAWNAYKRAKATWELFLYAPEHDDQDPPEAEDKRLSEQHSNALADMLSCPAPTIGALSWKLRAFRDEEVTDWDRAAEFVSFLALDAERLAAGK